MEVQLRKGAEENKSMAQVRVCIGITHHNEVRWLKKGRKKKGKKRELLSHHCIVYNIVVGGNNM